MSILNVNQIQPVGGGNTITVSASDVSASGATITASSFVGPLTGNVTGNITGTTSNASGATGDFSIADKIVHTGDTNTAIRFPAADTFTVETAGTERLRITAAGSVGIGNIASSNIKLDVEGSLRAKAAAYAAPTNGTGLEIYYATGTLNDAPSGYLLSYDRGASAYKKINYDASDHKFRTSGTERLRITSAGKVGIGTESPSTMLEVGSQSQTLAGAITISNGETIAGGSGPLINLKHGPAGGTQRTHQIYSYIGDLRIVADSNENMEFHTGGSESLRITSAGNVSIGGNVGVQTTYPTSATLVGAGSSLIGLYMGDGHMLFSDNLSRSGGYYIPNGINALNAGPVTLNSTMTLDGVWVIV